MLSYQIMCIIPVESTLVVNSMLNSCFSGVCLGACFTRVIVLMIIKASHHSNLLGLTLKALVAKTSWQENLTETQA